MAAACAARTGIADAPRAIGVTFLMALTHLGIGAAIGALVRSELNGSLLIVFVWMFDAFFGPALGSTATILRVLLLHFPTLVVTDVASGHAGPLGDVGLSAAWALAALTLGGAAVVATTRPAPLAAPRLHGGLRRVGVARRYGFRDYRRRRRRDPLRALRTQPHACSTRTQGRSERNGAVRAAESPSKVHERQVLARRPRHLAVGS